MLGSASESEATESIGADNVCTICGTTIVVVNRLPRGWKRRGNSLFCKKCWSDRHVIRAVSVPVAAPDDCSWDELQLILRQMWTQTTQASNWIATELYARDIRRSDHEKMPPMPKVYLYPELRERFPLLPAQTVASLEHAAQAKYRALRYKIIWMAEASLPTYRFPTPFPIPNQVWNVAVDNGRAFFAARIGNRRVRLRLKSGPQFRRQYQAILAIAAGGGIKGEAAIYKRGATLMVKLVAWLPREDRADEPLKGILSVKTSSECMLITTNFEEGLLWKYHGDHLRRWTAEHRKQLQRWADDTKYENRPTQSFGLRRSAATTKYRNRMNSACHEIAAQLTGYAARRRFEKVHYDDTVRNYCVYFPWSKLRSLIAQKLNSLGVEFEYSSGELKPDSPIVEY